MNSLAEALSEYLKIRRSLGYKLVMTERFLKDFINFLDSKNSSYITAKLALKWATSSLNAQPNQWARRLNIIRIFAEYQHIKDPRNEVPPNNLLIYNYKRKIPHIYSSKEISSLLKAAQNLKSKIGLRAYTIYTLLGLLAVTGMRISEVIKLNNNDVNFKEGILTVNESKFGKSRLIPVHESTISKLKKYKTIRDKIFPLPFSCSFFVGELGNRMTDCAIRGNFVTCSRLIGLRKPALSHGHGPRVHDFRHTFAVRTLIRWYQEGKNIERELPKLSTYLGHSAIRDTYWYITAVPELMQYAVDKINND